jgi:hypothetical protein
MKTLIPVAGPLPDLTEAEREELWSLVVPNPDLPAACWGWKGRVTTEGYAVLQAQGRQWMAYRMLYREVFGIDNVFRVSHHSCENGPYGCVSPHCTVPLSAGRNRHMIVTADDVDWESRGFLVKVRRELQEARAARWAS